LKLSTKISISKLSFFSTFWELRLVESP